VRVFNALIARGMDIKTIFAFLKRDVLIAKERIQPSTTHARRNPRMSNACYAKVSIQPTTKVV